MSDHTTPETERPSGGHEQLMRDYQAGNYGPMPAWGARKQSLRQLDWMSLKSVAETIDFVQEGDTIDTLAHRLGKKGCYSNERTSIVYQYDEKNKSSERIFI